MGNKCVKICQIEYLKLELWVKTPKGTTIPVYLTDTFDHIMGVHIKFNPKSPMNLTPETLLNILDNAITKHTDGKFDIRPYVTSLKISRATPISYQPRTTVDGFTSWMTVIAVLPSMDEVDAFYTSSISKPRVILHVQGHDFSSVLTFRRKNSQTTESGTLEKVGTIIKSLANNPQAQALFRSLMGGAKQALSTSLSVSSPSST